MIAGLSFPIRHLSVRVPWHDNGWNGTVCDDPKNNVACLKLLRIAERKDESLRGQPGGPLLQGPRTGGNPSLSPRTFGVHESAWLREKS